MPLYPPSGGGGGAPTGAAGGDLGGTYPNPTFALPYDAGNLTGSVTLDLANGRNQYGYMSANATFEVPTGTPVECGSEITFVMQWAGGAYALDFASGIKRASDSAAAFPKTLTQYKSYVFKLKFMGGYWCLVSLVGGFDESVD